MALLAWVALAPAQTPASPSIASQDLKADLAVLRRAYETLHPGLYRYNTREQMAAAFGELDRAFDEDLTLQQAFLALSRFTAGIKCGHSFPNPTNQRKAVRAELFQRQDKVPFCFRWIDGRMIVTRNLSEDIRLVPGAEVLEINGAPVASILGALMTVARADGSNDAKRASLMEVSGEGRYEAFDVYFPMLFPQAGPEMALRVRDPVTGVESAVKVSAQTFEQRTASSAQRREALKGGDAPAWEMRFPEDGVAYLRMETWAVYDSKWDWKRFLDDSFDTLVERNVPNLVIDLRGNEGGSSVGDVILARLVEKDVAPPPASRLVRYRKVPDDLSACLDTWDDSFKDWGAAAADQGNGFYRLMKYEEDGVDIKPRGKRYPGRVYVLVNAANSSATFEFALAVKELGLGTLVGQTTGGNQLGINGGAFFFLRLPKSGLEVDLPLIGYFPGPGGPQRHDAGLTPDILVTPRAEDIARGVDAEMAAVKQLMAAPK